MNTSKELIKTLTELETTVAAFTVEEINTIPFEGSWTPGKVARHLIKSYGVTQTINGIVTESHRQPDQNFGLIAGIFLNFDSKFQAAEFIVPEDKDYNQKELIYDIQQTRLVVQKTADKLNLTMLCLDFELPGSNIKLTRLEWLYLMLCHTKRHIHQLNKIKRHMHA